MLECKLGCIFQVWATGRNDLSSSSVIGSSFSTEIGNNFMTLWLEILPTMNPPIKLY